MTKKNERLEKLRKRIPLETKLKVALQAQDLDSWHNGHYSGHAEMYLHTILETIKKHEREHGVDASASILTLHVVTHSEAAVCANCGQPEHKHSAVAKLCPNRFAHFKQADG